MKSRPSHKLLVQTIIASRKIIYMGVSALDSILGRKTDTVILAYHNIGNTSDRFSITRASFQQQLIYLSKEHSFISYQDLLEFFKYNKTLPTSSVLITFDDGFRNLLNLVPFMDKLHIKPLVFVIANPEKAERGELGSNDALLSDEELKQLIQAGWTIGCHSATHTDFSNLSDNKYYEEIVESKKHLEKRLSCPITAFAFPKGVYNPTTIQLLKESGYELAFSMDDNLLNESSPIYHLPRVGIDRTHSFSEFKATMSPSVISIRRALKKTPIGKIV